MILISKTYEIVTEDSAENGETEEQGFLCQDVEYSFRELVELMKEYSEPSSYPARGTPWEWLTRYGEMDYKTGEYENEALHYSRKNPPKNAKYWKWAMKAAGFIK